MADDGVCDGSGLGEGFPGQSSLLDLLGQFISNGFKLTEDLRSEEKNEQHFQNICVAIFAHLCCFGVEDFFSREESLHVCDQKEDSGVVLGR